MDQRHIRRIAGALATVSFAALAACGDSRIKKLTVGIPKDSVLKILTLESAPVEGDSIPNVYRSERYLWDGHQITAWFYSKAGKKAGRDTIPEKDLTPIVLRDDTLTGWGWQHFDSVAKANNIPAHPHE
jgi:hypothetical protein